MKWYHYIICFILIVVGIFSTIELVDLFSVKSGEFGTAITFETKNDYKEISKFDLGSLLFTSNDQKNYSLSSKYAPAEFDGNKGDYSLLFNGQMANNVEVSAGTITGTFTITFYGVHGETLSTADFTVHVEYLASGTTVTVTAMADGDNLSYLLSYSNYNGAIIKVVDMGVV